MEVIVEIKWAYMNDVYNHYSHIDKNREVIVEIVGRLVESYC